MADYKQSLEVLDSWEGGYSLNPKDPGGETYCGISRRHWPNWSGWKFIDQIKSDRANSNVTINHIRWNEKFDVLNDLVNKFYMDNFWNKQDFKDLVNQDVADKIFQHYVNMDARAIKLAQAVIFYGIKNYITFKEFDGIQIDGQLGEITSSRINAKQGSIFLDRYIELVTSYYEELITEHPQFETFRHEWTLRAKTIGKRPN